MSANSSVTHPLKVAAYLYRCQPPLQAGTAIRFQRVAHGGDDGEITKGMVAPSLPSPGCPLRGSQRHLARMLTALKSGPAGEEPKPTGQPWERAIVE